MYELENQKNIIEMKERLEKIENILMWMQTVDYRINDLEDRCRKVVKYLGIEEEDIFKRVKPILGMK